MESEDTLRFKKHALCMLMPLFIPPRFVTLTVYTEGYKLRSYAFCSFSQALVVSFLLGNLISSTLFSVLIYSQSVSLCHGEGRNLYRYKRDL